MFPSHEFYGLRSRYATSLKLIPAYLVAGVAGLPATDGVDAGIAGA